MKNKFVLSAVAAVFACGTSYAAESTVFVAPGAAAERDGTAAHPFATPCEAKAALRALRKNAPDGGPWTISLAAGEYPLSEPLTILPEDSGSPGAPVTWRGPADGSARFVGARELKGWRVRPDGRWEVDAPTGSGGRPLWFEHLFVDGRRAQRARHPNAGFLVPKATKETPLGGDVARMELTARDGDLAPLAASPAESLQFAHIVVHHKWDTTRRIVLGFENGVVRTQGRTLPKWNSWTTASTYYVENVPAALDAPGEWLYDGCAKKILYIPRPGETPDKTRFQYPVPGLGQLLRVAGEPAKDRFVHDVVFENIAFEFADSPRRAGFKGRKGTPDSSGYDVASMRPSEWAPCQAAAHTEAAVLMDGARRVVMRGCEVAHVGEYGIWLREGCTSNRVERCAVMDTGAGGVRIGLPGATQPVGPGDHVTGLANARGTGWNVVDNCILSHGGRVHAAGVGVWIGSSPFNSITHCEISDYYYTGVSIGWVWGYAGSMAQGNTLAFCRIRKIGQGVLSDMGGLYTLGTSFGTCVSNNVIHAVDSYSYGGWGLYPDEGSEGVVMENNLVYDTKDSSFHQHYGRNNVLRNNILAFSRQCQVALTRAEPHLSFTAERNIIYWNQGPVFAKYGATLNETGKINWVDNFWWMAKGAPSFNGKTFAEWQAKGRDLHGLVADPLFEDADRRDFRLKPGSPVVKAGFRPFDISAAGVYGDAAWIRRADATCPEFKEAR